MASTQFILEPYWKYAGHYQKMAKTSCFLEKKCLKYWKNLMLKQSDGSFQGRLEQQFKSDKDAIIGLTALFFRVVDFWPIFRKMYVAFCYQFISSFHLFSTGVSRATAEEVQLKACKFLNPRNCCQPESSAVSSSNSAGSDTFCRCMVQNPLILPFYFLP